MTITRDFKTREIVIKWKDDILGEKEKRFPFEKQDEAMDFAKQTFNEQAM